MLSVVGTRVDDDSVWDAAAGLPVVLQDTRTQSGNSATTTFVYGLGLISMTDGAGVTSYYLSDGQGSTTQLTDSAGTVTDSYAYDVFGAPRAVTGTTQNDFRYTGQQDDRNANRGLYYLRARAYDPALGRFLQQDPLPLINRYAYAGGNPVNFADPSGLFPCPGCGRVKHAASAVADAVTSVALSGTLGYVDLNVSACYWVCVTGGVQWEPFTTHVAAYAGGGVGYTVGVLSGSVNFAPGQSITSGWSCAGQVSAYGGSYQTGQSGLGSGGGSSAGTADQGVGKEGGRNTSTRLASGSNSGAAGGTFFQEFGMGVGGPSIAFTCVYIHRF